MFTTLKIVRSVVQRFRRKKADKNFVVRTGVSQHVLDTADRLMKEYQEALEYLKDR